MINASNIAGVILAGGLSRRMGGQEKSLMLLNGKEPISWVAESLGPQVKTFAINANGDPDRFSFLDRPVLADIVEGFVGPLAGVLTGMKWAATMPNVGHIATAAADTPFFPPDMVVRMQEHLQGENDIVMASSVGRVHPVFALWPVHLASALEHFLVVEDKRKILEFANRYTLHEANFDDSGEDPFFNINTPEDLAHAEKMAIQMKSDI